MQSKNMQSIIFEEIGYKHPTYTFGKAKYGEFEVLIIKENGFINATKLCTLAGKKLGSYSENNWFQELVTYYNELSPECNSKIVLQYEVTKHLRGTYIHPEIIPTIIERMNKTSPKQTESGVRDRISKKLNGQIEVTTPVGRIDILTDTLLIEVKKACHWKSALGQVIAYGMHYPEHKQVIWLFDYNTKNIAMESTLEKLGIELRWVGMKNEFLVDDNKPLTKMELLESRVKILECKLDNI
jgi:hypothetical protein